MNLPETLKPIPGYQTSSFVGVAKPDSKNADLTESNIQQFSFGSKHPLQQHLQSLTVKSKASARSYFHTNSAKNPKNIHAPAGVKLKKQL